MGRALAVVFFVCALAASTTARAESDGDSYCTFTTQVARSQSALLYSPQLYLAYGYINGDDGATGATTAAVSRSRLTIGLRYSLSELYSGALTGIHARHDCTRYRALSQLTAFLESAKELESRPALAAKIAALEEALPRAAQILASAEAQAREGRATIEQLNATQLRVDALRSSLADARQSLAIASERPSPPARSISALQRERESEARAVELVEGRLRRAQGWDLVLRGGYDRLFGVRDQLPLFGIAMVSFNPGWFAQHGADRRALAARQQWERSDPGGTDRRVHAVLRQYAVIEAAERTRLVQTRALLADLETRWRAVEGLDGVRVQTFRDYLWFDLARLRSEAAYLEAHVKELEVYRGEPS